MNDIISLIHSVINTSDYWSVGTWIAISLISRVSDTASSQRLKSASSTAAIVITCSVVQRGESSIEDVRYML